MVPVLALIDEGIICTEIAKKLNLEKSHLFYYTHKAESRGFIERKSRTSFVEFKLTQAGRNFLDQYNNKSPSLPVCRLENMQFKARITKMPTRQVDWKKIEMNNWVQYTSEIDTVKVRLNMGKIPFLVIIPSPVEGQNIYDLIVMTVIGCINALYNLSNKIGLEVGNLKVISRPEWMVHDPIAKEFCKNIGQVTYEGVGKVNASKPRHVGELEFHDPTRLLDYIVMPERIKNIEARLIRIDNNLEDQSAQGRRSFFFNNLFFIY